MDMLPAAQRENEEEEVEGIDRVDDPLEIVPDYWEGIIEPKLKTLRMERKKVRKPEVVPRWFGDEGEKSSTDESSSDDEWKEVDRKERNRRKKKLLKEERLIKEKETARKAQSMIGVSEINVESVNYFEARVSAIKEFLAYNLTYSDEELDKLEIEETKEATSDKVIYMAVTDPAQVREIFYQKADSRNDTIVVRNYIPPQFFAHFTALNRLCRAHREDDNMLKKTKLGLG